MLLSSKMPKADKNENDSKEASLEDMRDSGKVDRDRRRKTDKPSRPKTKKYNSGSEDEEANKHKRTDQKHRSRRGKDYPLDEDAEKEADKEKRSRRPQSKHDSDKDIDDNKQDDSDASDSRSEQKPHEYKRYWGQGRSESRSIRQNNDRYWNKYQGRQEDRNVGSRYYGDSSSRDKRYDKENDRGKKRSNVDDDPIHRDDEKRSKIVEDKTGVDQTSQPQSTEASSSKPQRKVVDMLTSKTGGAYIPPARLRMMQAQITDKSSAAYQRLSWEALKKSIHGHINKVNTGNIGIIVRELLKENIVRGRGLLCRSIIQAQAASVTFTPVYAALVAVINSKFPNIGELLLKRLIIQFKRGFKRNDKSICISAATFLAHLVNQRVAHEILALEILTLLVESPTDDSVEVAIAFLKECGMKLLEVSSKGMHAIFEMLRNILHEGALEKRVQYMIEVMFQIRKDNFKDHEAIEEKLDLVDEEDQFTHLLTLEDVTDPEDLLNVFKLDPIFEENEAKYKVLREEILGEDSSESGSGSESEGEGSDDESESEKRAKEDIIIDNTETNLVALRRTIYLTIHSSLDFEECAHKLMRMELKPGQEIELCHMFLDCCAEQRTYEKFYGLLSQRFCQINKIFIPPFQQIFKDTYETIHRLDTNKMRNVAKFFAHLLFTDAISWEVLSLIKLNEEDTTSSSRIFIKILFQELSEYMGLTKLNDRVKDVTLQAAFEGLFPRDDPKSTRFAINFFTSIGLGGLTDELREHLKTRSKMAAVAKTVEAQPAAKETSSESSSSDSSSSSSSSDSSSDSSSESDVSEGRSRKKKSKTSKKRDKGKKLSVQRKKSQSKKSKQSEHKNKKRRH